MSEIVYNPEIKYFSENISFSKHYGIVYRWWNVFDLEKVGYVGMTLAVLLTNILESYRFKLFRKFNLPYAGRKINIARSELPSHGWRLEIICIVSSDRYTDTLRDTLKQEEYNIRLLDSVEKGYNTTYGGEHGYIDIDKYTLTKPLLLKLPKLAKNSEDNIEIFKFSFKQVKKFFIYSSDFDILRQVFSMKNISNGGFDESKMLERYSRSWRRADCLEDLGIIRTTFSDLDEKEQQKIKSEAVNESITEINGVYYLSKTLIKIVTKLLESVDYYCSSGTTMIEELGLQINVEEHYSWYSNTTNSKPCYKTSLKYDSESGRYINKVSFYGSRTQAYNMSNSGSYQRILYCCNNNTGGFRDGDVWDFIRNYVFKRLFKLD